MKKRIFIILGLIAFLLCLTNCNSFPNFDTSAEVVESSLSVPQTEKMLAALQARHTLNACALLHPTSAQTSTGDILQMIQYLDGRRISAIELDNIRVTVTPNLLRLMPGTTQSEETEYLITLESGESFRVHATYLSDPNGSGFVSFQILIGVTYPSIRSTL